MPNIHALNSDTHTLRIQYEYSEKQCVDVAIEGMDIWYMGIIFQSSEEFQKSSEFSLEITYVPKSLLEFSELLSCLHSSDLKLPSRKGILKCDRGNMMFHISIHFKIDFT